MVAERKRLFSAARSLHFSPSIFSSPSSLRIWTAVLPGISKTDSGFRVPRSAETCFGFSPALPQLLNQAGVTSFFTIKVNWSETNVMPYDLFWWEGLDGSRVLAHTFNNPVGGYNAEIGARAERLPGAGQYRDT